MNARLFVALALVASAFGQINFPTNATQLTIGTPVTTNLPIENSETYYAIPNLYYVFLPSNILEVNITLSKPSNSPCSYVDFYGSAESFPCPDTSPFTDEPEAADLVDYCYEIAGTYFYTSSSETQTLTAGDASGSNGEVGLKFVQGDNLYISIARDDSDEDEYAAVCPYTLLVTASYCPSYQVAVYDYLNDENVNCVNYTQFAPTQAANTSTYTITNNGTFPVVYQVLLPANTGSVSISISSNITDVYVFGNNKQAQSTSDISCEAYSTSGNGPYTGNDVCTGVLAGYFYVVVSSDEYEAYTATITITATICSNGAVGPFCNSTFVDLSNVFTATTNFVLPPYGMAYGYIDVTPAIAGTFQNLYAQTNSTDDLNVYISHNGFPTTDWEPYFYAYSASSSEVRGYRLSPFELNNFGTNLQGRYNILFYCDEDEACANSVGAGLIGQSTTGMYSTPTTGMVPATPTTGAVPPTPTTGVRMTTSIAPPTPTTGIMMTTAQRVTTQTVTSGRMTTGQATTGRMTSGVMPVATTNSASSFVPSMIALVALIALMF